MAGTESTSFGDMRYGGMHCTHTRGQLSSNPNPCTATYSAACHQPITRSLWVGARKSLGYVTHY